MKTGTRLVWALTAVLAVGLPSLPAGAQPKDPDALADGYAGGQYARIRHLVGGLTVRRAALDAESNAEINAPIFPGDTILTGPSETAEVELADGSLVRLDAAAELAFLALPDPYSGVKDNTVLQLVVGSLRVNARTRRDAEFRIDTAASSVYLLGDGDFRIDVEPSGRTRVASRRGVAEVAGGEASTLVRAGTLTTVGPASFPESARAFNTFARDAFDRWCDEREATYQVEDRAGDDTQALEVYAQIPAETRPYYRELSSAGRWTDLPEYGHAWYPVGVGAGWRPYDDGYWQYGAQGYFWVGSEPWGWAPYHYGRWVWAAPHGWCWLPGAVFGGAWVAWSWGPSYVGWAPLDYWNRPAFYGSIGYGYYDPLCWTFSSYAGFHHHDGHHGHDGHHDAYDRPGWDEVRNDLRGTAVVTRPPRVAPEDLATSSDARETAVRAANADLGARVREVTRETAPAAEPFVRSEQRIAERRAPRTTGGELEPLGARATRAQTGAPATRFVPADVSGRDPASRPARTEAAPRGAVPERVPPSAYPQRLRSAGSGSAVRIEDRSTRWQEVAPEGVDPRAVREPAGETAAPAPRQAAPRSPGDPREVYRRMATPRTTVRRPAETPPSPPPQAQPRNPTPKQPTPGQSSRPPKAPDPGKASPHSGARRQGSGSSATRSRGGGARRH